MNVRYSGLGILLQPAVADPQMILDCREILLLYFHVLVKIRSHKVVPIVVRILRLSTYCSKTGTVEVYHICLQTTARHGIADYRCFNSRLMP